MYDNNFNQYQPRQQFGYPDETQRPMQAQLKAPIVNSSQPVVIPGSKSLHLFNTLLLIFSAIQLGLYTLQGVTSQCPQLSVIFYGFAGVYAYTTLVPILLWLCMCWGKGYTFVTVYTIGGMLGKAGVAIAVFLATQNHVGYCYVATQVNIGIAIANVAEALCLAVELLFIRQGMKIQQLKQVQMFMEAGQRKGYF